MKIFFLLGALLGCTQKRQGDLEIKVPPHWKFSRMLPQGETAKAGCSIWCPVLVNDCSKDLWCYFPLSEICPEGGQLADALTAGIVVESRCLKKEDKARKPSAGNDQTSQTNSGKVH